MAERVRALAAAAAHAPPPAAAAGPRRAPSPLVSTPTAEQAAAPSLAKGGRSFVSAGDFTGRAKRADVKCGVPSKDPPGVGRCTNPCDQLYNTCPLPKDLPLGSVPAIGGPIGADPVLKLPQPLSPADVTTAVKLGLLTMPTGRLEAEVAAAINGTTAYAASQAHHAQPSPASVDTARATAEAISINAGDSWAIRNTNCQIAPIHGILNRVCTESLAVHGAGCSVEQLTNAPGWVAIVWHPASLAISEMPDYVLMPGQALAGMRSDIVHVSAQYNKYIMIDRIFFAADNQTPNPYGLLASEYDVTSDTFRNLSSGIISNSWCSAVRRSPFYQPSMMPTLMPANDFVQWYMVLSIGQVV